MKDLFLLVGVSGLLDKLESGDKIMADKGFVIQGMLTPIGVWLNIPRTPKHKCP